MSNWSLATPPTYRPDAVATASGWTDPVTGEVLVTIRALTTKNVDALIVPTFTMSVPVNGSYAAGATLQFNVTASEAVTVVGTPSIDITIGSSVHANTSLTWASNVVTATVGAGLLPAIGQTFQTTIGGATPAGYNGTFTGTVASATTFTYPLVANPGAETVAGTFTLAGSTLRQATYDPVASTSTVLIFKYVLVTGDTSAAGIAVANTIDLNTVGKGKARVVDQIVGDAGQNVLAAALTFSVPSTTGIITTA